MAVRDIMFFRRRYRWVHEFDVVLVELSVCGAILVVWFCSKFTIPIYGFPDSSAFWNFDLFDPPIMS